MNILTKIFICLLSISSVAMAESGRLHVYLGQEFQFSSDKDALVLRSERTVGSPIGRLTLGKRETNNGNIIISFYHYRSGQLFYDYLQEILKSGKDVTIRIYPNEHLNDIRDYKDKVPYYLNYLPSSAIIERSTGTTEFESIGQISTRLRRLQEIQNGEYYGLIGGTRSVLDKCKSLLIRVDNK